MQPEATLSGPLHNQQTRMFVAGCSPELGGGSHSAGRSCRGVLPHAGETMAKLCWQVEVGFGVSCCHLDKSSKLLVMKWLEPSAALGSSANEWCCAVRWGLKECRRKQAKTTGSCFRQPAGELSCTQELSWRQMVGHANRNGVVLLRSNNEQ